MRYHTTGSLSEHIKETPEGFLLCEGAAVARIGVQSYLPEEVPDMDPGDCEMLLIQRGAAELFSPATVASYEGKPVTLDHPDDEENDDFVTPGNFQEQARGHAQNLRPGAGKEADLLLADLVIMEAEAIKAVRGGLRELSCGYDADYEEISPGVGRQTNIRGNHIALVDRARGGPRCTIKDKDTSMPNKIKAKAGWLDRLLRHAKVRKALDEAAEEISAKDNEQSPPAKDDEPPAKDEDQAVTDDDPVMAKLEEMMLLLRSLAEAQKPAPAAGGSEEKNGDEDPDQTGDEEPEETADDEPDGTGDDEPLKNGDRAPRRAADAATLRRAKTLAPHIRARVGDSRQSVIRASLRSALGDPALAPSISSILGGKTLDSADGATLRAAFLAAAELARGQNSRKAADGLSRASGGGRGNDAAGRPTTPAQLNAQFKQFRDSLNGKKE